MKVPLVTTLAAVGMCGCLARTAVHPEAVRLNGEGARALAEGRAREARVLFDLSLEYGPCYAEALHNLGVWHLLRGELQAAAQREEEALVCRPDLVQARCGLGVVRWRQGDLDEARALFEETLRLDPGALDARRNLVLLDIEQGRTEEARAQLERLQALSPQDPILERLPPQDEAGLPADR
ncbi:MAG: tetratricopeptide repeat protein [Myxococcales bacterium]|nr:tetratricopeptide repeat protein [Myxococcales bacterium]